MLLQNLRKSQRLRKILCLNFKEFCRRMCLKWHFRDWPQGFNEILFFTPKATLHPPKENCCLEVFLSQVVK